jgi:transcriptional regulator with XRE-family HTH domain
VLRGLALLGRVVKLRRGQRGLSQRQLETLSGVDQTIISRLENGKLYGLRWARFARIVEALGGLDVSLPAPGAPAWPVPTATGPPDPDAIRAILDARKAHMIDLYGDE